MLQLTFYTTAGCHLCEQAKAMIAELPEPVRLVEFDIACDDRMIERYGLRIPLLKTPAGEELGWPFTAEQVLSLLSDRVEC
ncbi:glutaredoxin family protein [Gilvimarinus algae]|uniref:Glutaredoxin family protein n=1 Tax=Gilvimarinus algae TaxID=3058037 RepID=A0ABT8TLG8_9GAMM|nr:glutaredoxin family protein [Gilvimarinus sp. SDUM040014]MDO3384188.1 glutaredoxin family protein [Gilvimarinus sp. SDUM040014]